MARKQITRTLSSLADAPSLGRAHHKADRLLEILREVAVKNQREQPQPFHSMREVARRFETPTSMVARVYRRLEDEGLLSAAGPS